jgi:hypothetical protein
MFINDKRVRIITGYFGSGKSEFSLQYATKLATKTDRTIYLADLDIVNVYFRSRERSQLLKEKYNIEVLGNVFGERALTEAPHLSANVYKGTADKECHYIMDLAGSDQGLRILPSMFKNTIDDDEYDFFCVINCNRFETMEVNQIVEFVEFVNNFSKFQITGFVNNTNLIRFTEKEDILKGDAILKEVSKKMNIPIKYVMVPSELVEEVKSEVSGEIIEIEELLLREDWQ